MKKLDEMKEFKLLLLFKVTKLTMPTASHWAQTSFPCYSMLRCHGRAVALERDFDRGFSSTPNEILNVFQIVNESTTSELFGNRNQFVKFSHFLY